MQHSSLWALPPDTVEGIFSDLGREMAAHFTMQPSAALISTEASAPQHYTVQQGVACIPIDGVIDRVARVSWYSGQAYTAGQDRIRAAVAAALADPAVRALLLTVNSPGGVVAGTKELADFIALAAQRKPCAAYADGMCASAAYWLASATGRIFAPLTATVGSIGVIAVFTDWSKASEKYGVVRHIIAGGKWKAAGHPDKSFSEEDRQYFQTQISQLHGIFRSDVASAMRITADPTQWAEGQTLLAEDARELGLVTTIVCDRDAAVALLAQGEGWGGFAGASASTVKNKEKSMDMEQFKAQHPELYAAVLAEGKAQGEAATHASARESATASMQALVKAVVGEETAARVEAMHAAGITPAHLAAMAPLLGTPVVETPPDSSATATDAEQAARAAALAAITAATGGPLPDGAEVNKTQKSALVADAERRAVAGQQRI